MILGNYAGDHLLIIAAGEASPVALHTAPGQVLLAAPLEVDTGTVVHLPGRFLVAAGEPGIPAGRVHREGCSDGYILCQLHIDECPADTRERR